ncbi:MAG TPA: toll/interleukin-1 receptor domain-containing protein [Ktedonobacteraceae bacterium]|nr:toll/interleukin-1 receptor domain-containing protein [Ktedonobacteraceae bacterium]
MTDNSIGVFISYAHEDEQLYNKFETHFTLLKHQNLIATWQYRDISAGKEWSKQIGEYLAKAQLILLLVSSDFMASEYCYGIEMKQALQRHEQGDANVIPVLMRPVDLEGAPFEKLVMLPTNLIPVTKWKNRDEAFVNIVKGIRKAIQDWNKPYTFLSPQEKVSMNFQQTVQSPVELEKKYLSQFQDRLNKALSQLSSVDPNHLWSPEEVGSMISYLQSLERALERDYGSLAQQLSASGLPQLSHRMQATRLDIHTALGIYSQMYQKEAYILAKAAS